MARDDETVTDGLREISIDSTEFFLLDHCIMGLLTTKSCCFCLNLRTGGLALGYLLALHAIIAISDAIYKYIQPRYHGYDRIGASETTKFAVQIGEHQQIISHFTLNSFNFF